MASAAWFTAACTAFAPSTRMADLFSKSDAELAVRGYDRQGLTRGFITGHASF